MTYAEQVTARLETLTDADIVRAMNAAGQAGDMVAVAVCQMATGDDVRAPMSEHEWFRFEQLNLDGIDAARRTVAEMLVDGAEVTP